ncbi:MAG TPA: hypothetical protein VG168_14825, partial [Bryobacteraceae bacterium]|nr:hypothetical protein [Bryobacteraceae bacterium]
LWALGTVLFAKMFEDQPEEVRPGLIRAHTFVTYGKRFDNLFLQESRLSRRYDKLMKQLCDLKRQRLAAEARKPPERTGCSVPVVRDSTTETNGFEFSNSPDASRIFTPLDEMRKKLKEGQPLRPSGLNDRP